MNKLLREAIAYIEIMRARGLSDAYIAACYLTKHARLSAYEFNQLLREGY